MTKLFSFFCIIFIVTIAKGHEGNKVPLLLDTDAAIDDLRAISYFLNDEKYEIIGITTNDGALSPSQGLVKVKALLSSLGKENIPVAKGRTILAQGPKWRAISNKVYWGEEQGLDTNCPLPAHRLIDSLLTSEETNVTIVCLGPLTNLADAYRLNPDITKKMNPVLPWYNPGMQPETGVYYKDDQQAYDFLMNNSTFSFHCIHNQEMDDFSLDTFFINHFAKTDNEFSKIIYRSHTAPETYPKVVTRHYKLWDDVIYAFMNKPELFNIQTNPSHTRLIECTPKPGKSNEIKQFLIESINKTTMHESVIIRQFPLKAELYSEDLAPYVSRIIEKHGEREWKICVLTNEIHGHLGAYSTIGAKMGLFAMEYFNVGKDELTIESYAGSTPPVSCLNDGLQISTGATLGHGTIRIAATKKAEPAASFTHDNKTITLSLKPYVLKKIQQAIDESKGDDYWNTLRIKAIELWLDLERKEMFDIKEVNL